MKSVRFLSLSLIFLLAVGCFDREKSGVQHLAVKEDLPVFKATLFAKVEKDDAFSLYYTTDGSIDFTKIPAVWTEVKGNPEQQQITFSLPENTKPTQLRFDMGKNPLQPDMFLKRIRLSYKGKAVEIPGTLVFSYFRPNYKNTYADPSTGKINGIVENGEKSTPSLYPKEGPLGDEIEYLTK